MDVQKLKRTGLPQAELAKLFGVTRVTVNHWFTGRFNPGGDKADQIKNIANQLVAAVESGKLPLPKGTAPHRRVPLVREIIGLTD